MSNHGRSIVRRFVRDWAPPALMRMAGKLPGAGSRYEGPFNSWAAAVQQSSGYDSAEILERVRQTTLWALDAPDRYEQDSVRFTGPCASSHALTSILLGIGLAGATPVVWDIGGALGSHYLRWRTWLQVSGLKHWRVVEQSHFAAAGTALFESRAEPLSFHASIQELAGEVPAAALLSGVLQYIDEEHDPLDLVRRAGARVIVIDRTPFSNNRNGHILVQHTPRKIYSASYPLRTISHARVNDLLAPEYELLQSFDTNDGAITVRGASAIYRGQIWLRR